ncbi:hypothetical protein N7509_009590 [Penicillium cosmopolitanum]|uniref:Zn(2)-C6 fungal-type domain-containing protein n=1 Tax=Penicillium cosmopolitanum TaxID=1131564 RepID=A0A9X0B3R0_9EURO|nr:uncharacterized protein N7509_009590 [Penicillium cosmopolitanum]KAJ5387049.1 hypothetical protein N7509_009590 [Penicillium cosmopolitanum]
MEDTTPHKSRRAAKACAFCRQRKLRCNNEKPACSSCRGHGKECIYTVGPKRPRPSKAQLSRLEAENQQLRQQITASELRSESASTPTETRTSDPRPESQEPQPLGVIPRRPDVGKHTPSVDPARSTVSRIFISPNGDSSYHGLTSALFDDAPLDRRSQMRSTAPQVPVEHIQKRLMGESAYQRQLEMMNMREGRLDFDGVDPELGMHLLSLHWNRQHHSFLITYRPAFMRDMATNGPYFSKLLLNAIYFGASKFSNRPEVRRDPNDVRTAGWTFRMRVKELLGSALDRSEITTIQALLVMTSSLFALGDERSAAWLYAGTAFRMIIDLGMHVDATMLINMRQLSDEDLEIRRRVFWGAFVVDKVQALYQGRPATLQDFDTKVSLSFLDHYEELEHWQPFAYSDAQSYPGSPAYSVSTFTELCKLSLILNGILNKVYSERSSNRTPEELMATLSSLDAQLRSWQHGLPRHLQFSNNTAQTTPPPHVISLLSLYNVLLILLHRPFVAEGHLHTTDPSVAVSSFTTCTVAANRIINLLQAYDHAFSIRRAPYLISYATYVAATIHVRVAAQREGGSRSHASLQACLDIFQKNGETNWAVRRAQNVILHLMDRMGVDLNDQNPGFHSQGTFDAIEKGIQSPSIPSIENNLNISFGPAASPTQENPEIEPSELDMDMIIQSFIRQHSKPPEAQALYEGANNNFLSSGIPQFGTPGTLAPVMEACPQECFDDDMLFGFNGSPWNGMQYN